MALNRYLSVPIAFLLLVLLATQADARSRRSDRNGENDNGVKGGVSGELASKIDAAIAKGVDWLLPKLAEETARAKAQGARVVKDQVQAVAICAYALVASGVSPKDPAIQQAWVYLRDRPMQRTYIVSATLMLREAMIHPPPARAKKSRRSRRKKTGRSSRRERRLGNGKDDQWVRKAVNWLASGCNGGVWTYECPGGTDGYEVGKVAPEQEYSIGGTRGNLKFGAALAALMNSNNGKGDHSNSQYAVLGLKAGSLLGAKPGNHALMWRVVIAHFLKTQQQTGPVVDLKLEAEKAGFATAYGAPSGKDKARGWGYIGTSFRNDYGSMSTSGLGSILIAQSELELGFDDGRAVEQGIRDGLAWFQKNWTVTENPKCTQWRKTWKYYYLYGIERIGVIANVRTIGGHNWYAEGSGHIVSEQKDNGSWTGGDAGAVIRSSLALLYLARGTSERYMIGGMR